MEILRSNTVEALIAQNEDLMARLKVTLRRLTALENENTRLMETHRQTEITSSALNDQILVWKEKEKMWQEKLATFETQAYEFKNRFPEYLSMEDRLERYKRYHEKIKVQVKPYIEQLKEYIKGLTQQAQDLNTELSQREEQIRDYYIQIQQLKMEYEQLSQRTTTTQADCKMALEENQILTTRLELSLERQDELQNENISLRRSKEENEVKFDKLTQQMREENLQLKTSLTESHLQLEDLRKEVAKVTSEKSTLDREQTQLTEQLTSLRYQWTAKSEENERLKLAQEALEKINLDLSQKLNEARKGQASL